MIKKFVGAAAMAAAAVVSFFVGSLSNQPASADIPAIIQEAEQIKALKPKLEAGAQRKLATSTSQGFSRTADVLQEHRNAIESLAGRVAALESTEPPQPTDPPTSGLPVDVRSKSELVAFAQAMFPDELNTWAEDLRPFCRKLRDALAEHYPMIERINDQADRHGYTAPDEKHSDAYYRVDTDQIVDFMIDAESPGIPADRLTYGINPVTPW